LGTHFGLSSRRGFFGAAAAAVLLFALSSGPAGAGPVVDSGTLQPPPPPGTVCQDDGPWTICRREVIESWVLVPIFQLPCGQLYESATQAIDTRRWYSDGKLVKRHVVQSAEAAWTLSPTGTGPVVDVDIHANWWVDLGVPGDESTGSITARGNFATAHLPGAGAQVHIAGLDLPDGTHRGILRFVGDVEANAALCGALQA
jgi:hypothetical protein